MPKLPVSLDHLETAWLQRRYTVPAAMPGLNNELGSIQVEADIAAIKHPLFPPYSGGGEITGVTLLNGRNLSTITEKVEVRWRAYMIERRCSAIGFSLESKTYLLPNEPGCFVRVDIKNEQDYEKELKLNFLLSGRSINGGKDFAGWDAWEVPVIPTNATYVWNSENMTQSVMKTRFSSGVCFANEKKDLFSLQIVKPEAEFSKNGQYAEINKCLQPGEVFSVSLFFAFCDSVQKAEELAERWAEKANEALTEIKMYWENLWESAFTPKNKIFSGFLPVFKSENKKLERIYYNSVLTYLTCRRRRLHIRPETYYVVAWPRRCEGGTYLAWDLPYTSGILARLDPEVLKQSIINISEGATLNYQSTCYLNLKHGGWACCAQMQAITTACFNMLRWVGNDGWLNCNIQKEVHKKQERGYPIYQYTTVKEVLEEAVFAHRKFHIPGKLLVDYGSREAYLECITDYAHGTAGATAAQVWALSEYTSLTGVDYGTEIEKIIGEIKDNYVNGKGYFYCEYPDGTRHEAPNLYDLGLVLNTIGEKLPREMLSEIYEFVKKYLATPTWAHTIDPGNIDMLSSVRADHQWCGTFPCWPSQFILGTLRSEYYDNWLYQWIDGIEKTTLQGTFAQAYWAEDCYPSEVGGAATKVHDNIGQEVHWNQSSGIHYAEMILDGICGIHAGLDGTLSIKGGLDGMAAKCTVENISHRNKLYRLENGILSDV